MNMIIMIVTLMTMVDGQPKVQSVQEHVVYESTCHMLKNTLASQENIVIECGKEVPISLISTPRMRTE